MWGSLLSKKVLLTYWFLYSVFYSVAYSYINQNFRSCVNAETYYDSLVPFINSPALSIIYGSLNVFVIQGLYWIFSDTKKALRLYTAATLVTLISFGIYMFYPTCQDRSFINPNDVLKIIWRFDDNCNMFPSLHASMSTLFIINNKNPLIKLYYGLIIVTCVLIKQHVLLDIGSGILLAYVVDHFMRKFLKSKNLV